MSQGSAILPTAGIVSGVTMAQDINAALDAFRTQYSGASAPSADAPEEGQVWIDTGTSTSYKILKTYDGNQWLARAYLDDVNHVYIPPVGGGSLSVSSTAPNLGGVAEPSAAVSISGTTGITSFGSNAISGQIFFVTFQGILTLTYNAVSFILPGKANITTAAGDMSIWQYLGSGNWQCLVYQPIGSLVGSVGTVTGAFVTNNVISPTQITTNQNDYAPSGAANATIWELSTDGLSDYLITGISASQTSGRRILLRNVNAAGGGRIYFPNQSTSSLAANRFKQAGVVQLNPQQQVEFIYDNSVTAWVPQNVVSAQPTVAAFRNLRLGNAGANNGFTAPVTPAQQFKILGDVIPVADADGNTVNALNVSVTPDITVTGANGIDSTAGIGRASASNYSVWVIYNALTNTVAGLFSTSQTSPTMPSGYTHKARVGWAPTASTTTSFLNLFQQGRIALFVVNSTSLPAVVPIAGASSTGNIGDVTADSTWSSSTSSLPWACPPTASRIYVNASVASGGAGLNSLVAAPSTKYWQNPNGHIGSSLVGGVVPYGQFIQGSGSATAGQFKDWWPVISTNIGFATNAGAGFAGVNLLGWEDNI